MNGGAGCFPAKVTAGAGGATFLGTSPNLLGTRQKKKRVSFVLLSFFCNFATE